MHQERLWTPAVEAISIHAHFIGGQGWRLSYSIRREADDWRGIEPTVYERLSTPELHDVACSALSHDLRLG